VVLTSWDRTYRNSSAVSLALRAANYAFPFAAR
jgi:hypothetical protein